MQGAVASLQLGKGVGGEAAAPKRGSVARPQLQKGVGGQGVGAARCKQEHFNGPNSSISWNEVCLRGLPACLFLQYGFTVPRKCCVDATVRGITRKDVAQKCNPDGNAMGLDSKKISRQRRRTFQKAINFDILQAFQMRCTLSTFRVPLRI
uniref:Uncharacterized protein n=1 Tax=Trichuris muris TaxID=70415 RepID=A0A5S6QV56_TRIMR